MILCNISVNLFLVFALFLASLTELPLHNQFHTVGDYAYVCTSFHLYLQIILPFVLLLSVLTVNGQEMPSDMSESELIRDYTKNLPLRTIRYCFNLLLCASRK